MTKMKKKLLLPVVLMLLACGVYTVPAFADITFYDWAFNIDEDLTVFGDALPGAVDDSGFDFTTGLGELAVTVTGAGAHSVGLFVDYEMTQSGNTYYNEYGEAVGTPAAGQSWEIDEPGFVFGDIDLNFPYVTRTPGDTDDLRLDNFNNVPQGLEDDVSMALGWDIDTGAMPGAIVTFLLSTTKPTDGFYLHHADPLSDEHVYFSSTVVPVPGALLLGSIGVTFAGWLGKRKREM